MHFFIPHMSHCHGVSGLIPWKICDDIPRYDLLYHILLQSSQATGGFVLLRVTARSHIPHGNFVPFYGWLRYGWSGLSLLMGSKVLLYITAGESSVCFSFVIKQGCVACKVAVSAFGLTMSHKVTMT